MNYNPKESGKSQTNTKTIVFLPNFVLADVSAGDNPGEIYDSKYSRVNVSLLDHSDPQKKTSVTANIKLGEAWSGLVEAFHAATTAAATRVMTPASGGENVSPAYTTTILCGTAKGKTPAQVLSEPGGEDILINVRSYLAKNSTGAYANGNKQQVTAIDDALELYRSGKLKASNSASAGGEIVLYDAPSHGNPYKPHKDNPNMFFCNDCKITYTAGKTYPVTVMIANYYAPIERKEGGQQLVKAKEAIETQRITMSLSQAAFAGHLDEIARREQTFLTANATKIEAMIEDAYREYRNSLEQNVAYDAPEADVAPPSEPNGYQDGIFTLVNVRGIAIGMDKDYLIVPCRDQTNTDVLLYLKNSEEWVQKYIDAVQTGSYPLSFKGKKKDNKYVLIERVKKTA